MARLPQSGGDDGVWGTILNEFLSVEHNTDGSLKPTGSLGTKYTKPAAGIPESDLSAPVLAKINNVASGGVLVDDSVSTATVQNNAIIDTKIADGAVTNTKVADGAVTNAKVANNAVTNGKIADNAVTTAKVADAAVTGLKLADNAVTSAKVTDGAITGLKLADGAVGGAKLADNAVTGAKLADNTVTGAKISDGAVTGAKLADGLVTNVKVAAGAAIDQSKINGLTASLTSKLNASEKAAVNGVASLGVDGKVPTTQLPTFVQSVAGKQGAVDLEIADINGLDAALQDNNNPADIIPSGTAGNTVVLGSSGDLVAENRVPARSQQPATIWIGTVASAPAAPAGGHVLIFDPEDVVTDTTPPTVPTNVAVANITTNSMTISWTASTDATGVASYEILRNGVMVGTSVTTSYNATGLSAATTYQWTVIAIDTQGNRSGASTAASGTTTSAVTAPAAPSAPTLTAGNTTLQASWSAPASDGGAAITDYVVGLRVAAGTWGIFNDGTSSSLAAIITSLTNGTAYEVRIAAVNSVGQGPWSTTATATPIASSASFSDNFDRANGAPGSNWTIATSTWAVSSNQLVFTGNSTLGLIVTSGEAPSADMYAQVRVTNPLGTFSVIARGDSAGNFLAFRRASSTTMQIGTVQGNGAIAGLITVNYTLATNDVMRIECQGTTVRGLVNGTVIVTATNVTAFTGDPGSRHSGFRTHSAATQNLALDDFEMGAL